MDKTKEQIIVELHDTHFVENYTRKLLGSTDSNFEDIVGELYLIICSLSGETICSIYNGCGINCFRRYVSGIISRQIRSETSRVWRVYRRDAAKVVAMSTLTRQQWEGIEKKSE